tara:strand:+ start:624 stop:1367 length:744 start_codon:yes stop_codon:yes gene_type:complete
MKRSTLLLTAAIGLSMAFSGQVDLKKDLNSSSVKLSLSKSVTADQEVKGLQFDLHYNSDEIKFEDASSLLNGFTFEFQATEAGTVKGLIFSMSGQSLNPEDLSNVLEFNFSPVNGFAGESDIQLVNMIIAGKHGENITGDFSIPVSSVSFENTLPLKTELSKNYPNPFNPTTTIPYELKEDGLISMVVYDLNGAEVKTLVSENVSAGSYQAVWNGLNNTGQNVASGRYIVKMSAPGFSDTITMTLLK